MFFVSLASAKQKEDPCQLKLKLGFSRPTTGVRQISDLRDHFTQLGWQATYVYDQQSSGFINDLIIFSPKDSSGRFVVIPGLEGPPILLTALDRSAIDDVIEGIRPNHAMQSAQELWKAHVGASSDTLEAWHKRSLKSSLKKLGFQPQRVLRKATCVEGNISYPCDGVMVMKAAWSRSEITLVDVQFKKMTYTEVATVLNSILDGVNYTTLETLTALKRGNITFRLL
jgi:hypothetical protein